MLAGVCVPQERAAVVTRRRQQAPVRTEIHRVDVRGVTGESAQLAPRRQVPNLDRVVAATRSQEATIPTESNLRNAFAVTLKRSDFLARGYVPELHLPDR